VKYAVLQCHYATCPGAVGLPIEDDVGNDGHGVAKRSQGENCTAGA
jgi:hypothetical protein